PPFGTCPAPVPPFRPPDAPSRANPAGTLPSADPALRQHDRFTDSDTHPPRRRRRRFDDDEPFVDRRPAGPAELAELTGLDARAGTDIDGPPTGDRWSTWDGAAHGPRPRPPWVITEHGAV